MALWVTRVAYATPSPASAHFMAHFSSSDDEMAAAGAAFSASLRALVGGADAVEGVSGAGGLPSAGAASSSPVGGVEPADFFTATLETADSWRSWGPPSSGGLG